MDQSDWITTKYFPQIYCNFGILIRNRVFKDFSTTLYNCDFIIMLYVEWFVLEEPPEDEIRLEDKDV